MDKKRPFFSTTSIFLILFALGFVWSAADPLEEQGSGPALEAAAPVSDPVAPGEIDLVRTASELNRKFPMLLDADTRIDSVTAGPGKVLTYRHTMVQYAKDPAFDREAFVKGLEPLVRTNSQTNPQMKKLRDSGVSLNYHYSDKNGEFLAMVSAPAKGK